MANTINIVNLPGADPLAHVNVLNASPRPFYFAVPQHHGSHHLMEGAMAVGRARVHGRSGGHSHGVAGERVQAFRRQWGTRGRRQTAGSGDGRE